MNKNITEIALMKAGFHRVIPYEWKDERALQLLLCGCNSSDGSNRLLSYSYSSTAWSYSHAYYSARLALKSEAIADYCGKQFATLWAEYYTGKVCKPWREVKED